MKRHRIAEEEKIEYQKMLGLYEQEGRIEKSDVKFRKAINDFRKSIGLEPEYLENGTKNETRSIKKSPQGCRHDATRNGG